MRLLVCLALFFGAAAQSAAQAPAGCREARGGHMQDLKSTVAWQARTGCGEGTLVWFGHESQVDDLLIVADLEKGQALSLLSPLGIECRHQSDRRSLVIAVGEWSARTGQGERQHVHRAWRFDAASRTAAEVPIREVSCMLRNP
ncbi:MAG TPA: hypothetical protein VES36_00135 [Candidatus Limnocylindrales bacterium]|nr:hypothetical protein [Candidatus Limnocylindrales bacterium]